MPHLDTGQPGQSAVHSLLCRGFMTHRPCVVGQKDRPGSLPGEKGSNCKESC